MAPYDLQRETKALLRALRHGGGKKCSDACAAFVSACEQHKPLRVVPDGAIDALAAHANDKQAPDIVVTAAFEALFSLFRACDQDMQQQVASNTCLLR